MDPIMFVKKTTDINFEILNMANKFRYMIEVNKYKRYILKNSRFKDKHAGETCFIIGNGPSIKEMDLSKLSDKYTFMVNASINTKLFDVIKPNYHCVYDRAVLNELSDVLRKNFENNKYNTEFFLNRIAMKEFKDYKNVNFVYSTILPIEDKIRYDLTKNANVFINVLPFAIMCALYMGFKKIILLGCDFSFFAYRKQAHFYDIEKQKVRKETLYQDLAGCAIAWQQYNSLKKFAMKNNIEIINSTPNSLLDVFPQVSIEEYI